MKPAVMAETHEHNASRLKVLFVPPKSLLERVRWIFLLFSLLNAAIVLLMLAFTSISEWTLQVAAIFLLAFLVAHYVRGYRHGSFSPIWDVPEVPALFVVLAAVGPEYGLGLLYVGLFFRSLYGSVGPMLVRALLYFGAFASAVALMAGEVSAVIFSQVVPHAIGLVTMACVMNVLATTLGKYERAMRRERILRETSAVLVTALDRKSIYTAALEGTRKLMKEVPRTRASIAVGPADRMTILAAVGDHAAETEGAEFNLHDLPVPIRTHLLQKQSFEVNNADLTTVREAREALGFESKTSSVYYVPLLIREELGGLLVVSSDSPLPRELKDSIETFGSQTALALESVTLTEELYQQKSEARFRSLVQNSSDIITIAEADGTVRYESPAIERVLGYRPEEWIGTNAFDHVHPDDMEQALSIFAEALDKPGAHLPVEFRVSHTDGSWRYLEHIVNNQLDDPNVRGIVVNSRDITERKALEEQLRHQALHDPLTELPNRALFLDRLEHALTRTRREDGSVAVIFVDLDNFKVINDSLGHDAGNALLVQVAQRLKNSVRPGDTVGRIFGDEFAVLLEAPSGVEEARQVTERIQERLQTPFDVNGREVFVSSSIGVALGKGAEDEPKEVLRRADLAMYAAKSRGKERYEVYSPSTNTWAQERIDLESDLRRAVERGEFEVHYQPMIELHTGRTCGFEALARWRHPERGLVAPLEFIQLAEQTGLIHPVGRWVIEEACRQARLWQEQYPDRALLMSVNLSTRQFSYQSDPITEILDATELDPRNLQLELTEQAVMDDAEFSLSKLQRLKGLGVSFAIDDFGTGYSSLSYLKRFPVNQLKIDQSFVTRIGEDSEDEAIVSGTIGLGHALGLKVVAEGVETEEQLVWLREMGCDLAQGHYFAKPLPGEDAERLLVEGASC